MALACKNNNTHQRLPSVPSVGSGNSSIVFGKSNKSGSMLKRAHVKQKSSLGLKSVRSRDKIVSVVDEDKNEQIMIIEDKGARVLDELN